MSESENTRQGYIDGLRQLASLLASNPDIPTPYLSDNSITWSAWGDVAEVARLTTLIPGTLSKNDPDASSYDSTYYILTSSVKFGPFTLRICSERSTVCERVQTGMTTVVVPAVEAQPKRVEKVPVFEYVCSPLLAKVGS